MYWSKDAMSIAIHQYSISEVKNLCDSGYNVNSYCYDRPGKQADYMHPDDWIYSFSEKDYMIYYDGYTPLMLAITLKHFSCAKYLYIKSDLKKRSECGQILEELENFKEFQVLHKDLFEY